jgi:hypothetical protein
MPMQRNDETTPGARPPQPSRRRLTEILVVVVLLVAAGVVAKVVLWPGPQPPEVITPSTTIGPPQLTPNEQFMELRASRCLSTDPAVARTVTRVTGTRDTYRLSAVPNRRTYDLRGGAIVGYPQVNHYPLALGKYDPGNATCVVGGSVVGRQSRNHTWQTMKSSLDGDGLNFKSDGGIIDGIRIDNVEDGIGTIGGDPEGIMIRNAYMSYIRDDCIENDAVVGLIVKDSLLDGCFFGLSERPGASGSPRPAPPGERTLLDGVLLRLQPMPYDTTKARCGTDGLGTGGFFKWSDYANKLTVRNSVLLADRTTVRCAIPLNFPATGTYENVTLVWLGQGNYPGRLPATGVTVTRDRQVWDRARADWLQRHGQPS